MNIMERFSQIIAQNNDCVVFEIGACDGVHTHIMCNTIRGKGISNFSFHAFEPSPDLTNRFLSNNLQHFPNLKFVPAAIGAIDGTVDFYLSSGEETREGHFKQSFYGSSSIKEPYKCTMYYPDIRFKKIQSRCYRLDTYCTEQKIDKIDFIWADVQGAEKDMIEGGKQILQKTRYLYTEVNGDTYKDVGYDGVRGLLSLLPGNWSVVEEYDYDVLFKNDDYPS